MSTPLWKGAPKPCGPNDGRLTTFRCQSCRKSKTKCVGPRPCARCRSRGLECLDQIQETQDLVTINYTPPPVNSSLSDLSASTHGTCTPIGDSERRSPSRKEAASPSVITAPFRHEYISQYRDYAPLQMMTDLVERFRARSVQDPQSLVAIRRRLSVCLDEILETTNGQALTHESILFIVSLCYFEFTIEPSGLGFFTALTPVSQHMAKHPPPQPAAYEQHCTLVMYELLEANRGLILDEDHFLPTDGVHDPVPEDLPASMHDRADLSIFQRFAKFSLALARLNAQTEKWIEEMRVLVGDQAVENQVDTRNHSHPLPDQLEHGRVLCSLGRKALSLLEPLNGDQDSTPDSFASLRPAFYHCGRISITRLYTDPLWHHADPDPPAADLLDSLERYALIALSAIERRAPLVRLEALLYNPLLLVISLEIKTANDRERIIRVLRETSRKGFLVSDTYLSDIQASWDLLDRLARSRKDQSNL